MDGEHQSHTTAEYQQIKAAAAMGLRWHAREVSKKCAGCAIMQQIFCTIPLIASRLCSQRHLGPF